MRHIIPATDFNPHEREARDGNDRTFHRIRLYFNPHEREARDAMPLTCRVGLIYFNPHEREARDAVSRGVHSYTAYFNPHEREARDRCGGKIDLHAASILIHTSVKLVTSSRNSNLRWQNSF